MNETEIGERTKLLKEIHFLSRKQNQLRNSEWFLFLIKK